jgi:serine/threonine protein kinase
MASVEVNRICETLLRLGLLEQRQLDDCLTGAAAGSADLFLQGLERKGLITNYQSQELKKSQTTGLVLGHYALLYQNASGSFARVFRAKDLTSGKMMGLKVLRSRYAKDPKAIAEFKREAELGKTLKHDNIVPIYEVGSDRGEYYLSMEFVEGGNLRDFMNIRKKLSVEEATKCTLDLAAGLAYAQEKGLSHRDLKLTNVLMSTRGVAKLVDFGLAGLDPTAENKSNVAEGVQRAIEYATLEKNTGAPRNDPRSDLYFLGAIYYELLTGIPALPRTKDRDERGEFQRYANVTPILEHEPTLPIGVVAVIQKLMQVDVKLRYQTATDVATDLRQLMEDYDQLPSLAALTNARISGKSGVNGSSLNGSSPDGGGNGTTSTQPMVLCVEVRLKHQDVLRTYLTKHGYRPLMFSDMQRAVNRVLASNPPAAVIIMGDGIGHPAVEGFKSLCEKSSTSKVTCLLILSEKQQTLFKEAKQFATENCAVMQQPLTLRDLHHAVRSGLKRTGHLGKGPEKSVDDAESSIS